MNAEQPKHSKRKPASRRRMSLRKWHAVRHANVLFSDGTWRKKPGIVGLKEYYSFFLGGFIVSPLALGFSRFSQCQHFTVCAVLR